MAITVGRRSALALLAGLPLLATGTARAQSSLGPGVGVDPHRTPVRYTMTAFRADSDTTLAVYESADGTDFTPVSEHAYTPPGRAGPRSERAAAHRRPLLPHLHDRR
ncbi:hypothetical protein ACFWVM_04690 [Nocardia fluminea]|uniref:hypothetical protein n=1 Tax=Nocardia fluminea TaxID=134984 RepID=UPI003660FC24